MLAILELERECLESAGPFAPAALFATESTELRAYQIKL